MSPAREPARTGWLGSPADGLLVVPAIDLLDGKVVRLLRGRYDRVTEYHVAPEVAARRFVEAGAPALHVVDLDGARSGAPVNTKAVEAIAAAAPEAAIQLGGGIRTLDDARLALDAGADAVIVGSRAVRDPVWLADLVGALGAGAVIGSLDLRDGRIAVEGWTETAADDDPEAVWRTWVEAGLVRAIVTDTARDGTMEGALPASFRPFLGASPAVAAAGGVAGPEDLQALARAGLDAAVTGRALYDRGLDVETLASRGWRWSVEDPTGVGPPTDPGPGGA